MIILAMEIPSTNILFYLLISRGTPSEETVLSTAFCVVEYVLDKLHVDPNKLIL